MKVKINRVRGGSMGDQRNYGLVTGSIWNYENKTASNNVTTTLSAVPRDEATIEAERGETVVGDLDNDGMVEHAKIGGKRHSQGGTPLNVPDGSFVFSDYRGLLIKNKDLLKGIFNMSSSKAVTPAKVAQRYDLNRYKALLNDPNADAMTKKTAQLMIDNNMKKLGQLALVQEGMKGFPDGIPAIAMPLLGSDFKHPQGPQKMKRGGTLRRAQDGEETKWMTRSGSDHKYQYETLDDLERRLGYKLEANPSDPGVFYDPGDQSIPVGIRRPGQNYFVDQSTGNISPLMDEVVVEGKLPLDYYFRQSYEQRPGFEYWQTPDGQRLDTWQSGAVPKIRPTGDAGMLDVLGLTGGLWGITQAGKLVWNAGKWTLNTIRGTKAAKTAETAAKAAEAAAEAEKVAANAVKKGRRWTRPSEQGLQESEEAAAAYEAAYAAAESAGATAEQANASAEAYTRWQQAKDIYAGSPLLKKVLPWVGLAGGLGIVDATTDLLSGPQPGNPGKSIPANPIGTPTVPSVTDTGKLAKAQADSLAMFNIFKQLYPTASNDDIKKMMRDPVAYHIADSMFRTTPMVDSNKVAVDSNKVLTNYSAADSIAQAQAQAAAAKAQAEAEAKARAEAAAKAAAEKKKKVIKIRRGNYHPKDTTGSYLWPKKTGGELQKFADTGEFTQLIPETALQNTDDFEVIMPNKKFGAFDTQHYDPDLGYYTVTNSETNAQEALDVDNFITRHDTILKDYGSGVDSWRADATSRDNATREKAVEWFQNKYNEWRKANGLSEYFVNKKGPYQKDKKFGIYTWSAPGIKKKVKKVETKTEKDPEETPEEEVITTRKPGFQSPTGYGLGQWFPSDQAAMIAAAGMKIPDYHAYYGLPNPSLMSPVYRNENYEPIGAVTQTVEGMGTGPEARGSALGVTGKGLKAASDIQQQTEALNTDQFLKTQAANVQNINQFTMLGEKEKSDYMNSINAIAKENAMNQNAKDAGFASAFGKGYNNVLNQMLINAQYPYQFQTPYSVAVNPTLKSIYDTPLTGGGSGVDYNDAFDYYYKMYSDPNGYGLDKKEAIDAANTAARNYLNSIYQRNRGTGTGGAILSPFGQ